VHDKTSIADMELRDWFAGQALIGLIAAAASSPEPANIDNDYYVARAYRIANTMMRERSAT
jgi:hypothetical protein